MGLHKAKQGVPSHPLCVPCDNSTFRVANFRRETLLTVFLAVRCIKCNRSYQIGECDIITYKPTEVWLVDADSRDILVTPNPINKSMDVRVRDESTLSLDMRTEMKARLKHDLSKGKKIHGLS